MSGLLAAVEAIHAALRAGDAPGAVQLLQSSGLSDPTAGGALRGAELEALRAAVDEVLALALKRREELAAAVSAGGVARRAERVYRGRGRPG
jgi:hypothetical protein